MHQGMDMEFHESDIIFSSDYQGIREGDDNHDVTGTDQSARKGRKSMKASNKNGKKMMMIQTAVPIDIPCNLFHHKPGDNHKNASHGYAVLDYEDYGDQEMVPPHVIVGQRIAGNIAFSVYTGIGRTLKGRDLSEVRNSILRLTGFLES